MSKSTFIFDLDDTIYLRRDSILRAMDKVFPAAMDPHKDDEKWRADAAKLFLKNNQHFFELNSAGKIDAKVMVISRITKTMGELGLEITEDQALEYQSTYEWEQYHLQMKDNVRACLEYLRSSECFLGMVTNGLSDHQRAKYRALGVNEYIPEENVLVSADVQISKPDPRILAIAQERWNLDLENTWYVGDSLSNDINCAKAAGWKSIWLKHTDEPETEEEGVTIVHTPEELLALFQEIVKNNG